ncbi:methyl-CpG-binding protein 2-like [Agelaius tricolor]|uniref:methyl-CpG-binding protein 2-like n=1 Tax=Agelaius tricolor TaxID=9191 RepID=UPI0039F18D31
MAPAPLPPSRSPSICRHAFPSRFPLRARPCPGGRRGPAPAVFLSMVRRGRSAPLGGRARAGPGSPRRLRAQPALLAPRARSAIAAGSRPRAQPGRQQRTAPATTNGRVGPAIPGPSGPVPPGRRMEKPGRMDCPALPPGWKKEEVIRKSGLSAGKSDVYYFSPSGKKFRSKPQLARYLGNSVDLSSFDFRTGKMMPSKLQKNKQKLRSDALNPNKGKPDLNTTLPIRQTASIFPNFCPIFPQFSPNFSPF